MRLFTTTATAKTKKMNEQEIRAILNRVLAASKTAYVVKDGEGMFTYVPKYYPGYAEAVKQRDRIANHAEVDKYPEDLFYKRAPNETEEEAEYIKANYKNVTHTVFADYLAVIGRCMADGNWSIMISNDEFAAYVNEGIETHGSIEAFIKDIILTLKAKDPNGVIAIDVPPLPTVVVDDVAIPNDTEKFKPHPLYYPCDAVVAWSANKYALLESFDRAVVMFGGKPQKVGRVFYFYDRTTIWKIEQYGAFVDHNYSITPIFDHGLDRVPVHKLMGVPSMLRDGSIYYTSKFYYAVDPLDTVLTNDNYLQCSVANCMFPFRIMVGDVCDFIDPDGNGCSGGHVTRYVDGEASGRISCPSCKGSGMKVRVSPMGTFLLKPKEGQDEGDSNYAKPVEYITPSTEAGKFVKELIDQKMELAKSVLHIHSSSTDVKGLDRTATGDAIDLKAMYSFIRPESEQIFDLYEWLLVTMADVRGDSVEIAIQRPRTFDFRTDADMLADIGAARGAGAPDVVLHALIYQYIENRFYSDTEGAEVFRVILAADRLLTLSGTDIQTRSAQGQAQAWEVILHDSAVQIINELIAIDPTFLSKPLDEKVAAVVAAAKAKAPAQSTREQMAARLLNG